MFVMIFGAIAFLNSFQPGRGIADAAHLGGLVTGYLYLQSGRGGLTAEIKYRYLKWKMNRLRRKFDVYSGGRSGAGTATFTDTGRRARRRARLLPSCGSSCRCDPASPGGSG